ncbi:MAG: ApaG domain [Puniceicoccaceae bacterium]
MRLAADNVHLAPTMEIQSVRVEIVSLIHSMDAAHFPEPRPHAFAYHIRIRNDGEERVVLNARKWVLRFADGRHEVYEGDRIVGRIVDLDPGDTFEYSSYHVVDADCEVTGAYHGYSDSQESIWVRIPKFQLYIPENLP